MHYFFSCILAIILSAAFIFPAGAQPHKPKIDKDVMKEIRRARLTGRYGDLTDKAASCECSDRNIDQITRIVIHSTHVVSSTGTINCKGVPGMPDRDPSPDCTGTIYIPNPAGKNARVTLKAKPDPGSIFSGWSGACRGTKPCTVRMDTAKTVSAIFEKTAGETAMSITGNR